MRAVIDASVALAYIQFEPGGASFFDALAGGSVMSVVNIVEVAKRLRRNDVSEADIDVELAKLDELAVPFELVHVPSFRQILPHAKRANLSLADCACLATARHMRLPALTADKAWAEIAGDVGVEVLVVR